MNARTHVVMYLGLVLLLPACSSPYPPIKELGFGELRPPTTLYAPGTVLREKDGTIGIVCTAMRVRRGRRARRGMGREFLPTPSGRAFDHVAHRANAHPTEVPLREEVARRTLREIAQREEAGPLRPVDRSRRKIDLLENKKQPDPEDELKRKEITEFITKGLSRKERLIMILYYYEDLTMREIGATLNLSESRVCQLHSRIIFRLKNQLKKYQAELLS